MAAGLFLVLLIGGSRNLNGQTQDHAQWLPGEFCDFFGRDLDQLRALQTTSEIVLAGCRAGLNWPEEFPGKLAVRLSGASMAQVREGAGGGWILQLPERTEYATQVEWLTRGLLSLYGKAKGIEAPPPLWLVHAIEYLGVRADRPQMRTLLIRRLNGRVIPALSQRVQRYDRATDPGWDYLLFRFLESGGHPPAIFKKRLEQFWANGYNWTQLNLFFTGMNAHLNGAELELLWRTFVAETLASESAVCLSESASLAALEKLTRLEVMKNSKPETLAPNTWYLYRSDPVALSAFNRMHGELEVLVHSMHPYYFNACHSLDRVLRAISAEDLKEYREAVNQWNQDLLDARQLGFETDRLLRRMCPEKDTDAF